MLFRSKTWGENVIGNAGVGFVFGFIITMVVIVGVALTVVLGSNLGATAAAVMGGLTLLAVLLLALVQAALAGIYSAALYRYAELGNAGGAFDGAAMASAFRGK